MHVLRNRVAFRRTMCLRNESLGALLQLAGVQHTRIATSIDHLVDERVESGDHRGRNSPQVLREGPHDFFDRLATQRAVPLAKTSRVRVHSQRRIRDRARST